MGMSRRPRHPDRKKGTRGRMVSCRLDDPALEAAFEKWCADQRVRPENAAVVLKAVEEFLQREGYYKPAGG